MLPPLAVALPAIGVFLKSMRIALGLTQDQLAAKTEGMEISVSRTTISAIEKGKYSPNAVTLMAITSVLHIDPMEVFDRLKMATAVPAEYREWSLARLDARSVELFAERRFRETLTILDTMMARLVETEEGDAGLKPRRMAAVEVRRATILRRLGALVAARESAERAISLSAEHNDLMAQGYIVLVAVQLRRGHKQLALDAVERAVAVSADAGPSILGQALLEKGRAFLDAGRFTEAFQASSEALHLVTEGDDRIHVLTCTGNIGLALFHLGKRTEARTRIRSAIDMARKQGRGDFEARWLLELGRMALEEGRHSEAAQHGNEALRIAQLGEHWQIAFGASMLLHRVAKITDPAKPDRHRMAYLRRLCGWVEEDVSDPDVREFLQEVQAAQNAPQGEA